MQLGYFLFWSSSVAVKMFGNLLQEQQLTYLTAERAGISKKEEKARFIDEALARRVGMEPPAGGNKWGEKEQERPPAAGSKRLTFWPK